MNALGRHLLLELFDCDTDAINNVEGVKGALIEAAKRAQATIVDVVFHEFNPFGVSGVVVIAESHLSIHTWPEYRYAAVDIFTRHYLVRPPHVRVHADGRTGPALGNPAIPVWRRRRGLRARFRGHRGRQ